ncbi:MAG: hypothetical protein ACT4PT_00500, partial [Methanobacteriota archaeon]
MVEKDSNADGTSDAKWRVPFLTPLHVAGAVALVFGILVFSLAKMNPPKIVAVRYARLKKKHKQKLIPAIVKRDVDLTDALVLIPK